MNQPSQFALEAPKHNGVSSRNSRAQAMTDVIYLMSEKDYPRIEAVTLVLKANKLTPDSEDWKRELNNLQVSLTQHFKNHPLPEKE